jgi:hypothetical protein
MEERWRPVLGFEDYYEVSDLGRVRSLPRDSVRQSCGRTRKFKPRVLRPQRDGRSHGGIGAHVKITLSVDSVKRQRQVHILVLEAFVGLRPQGTETRHLNGIPDDNRLVNLCWGTPAENRADTLVHGTLRRGVTKPNAKLSEADVIRIRSARQSGAGINALARQYGVERSTIQQIFNGRTWTHVCS